MLDNATRRQLLERHKSSGFPGSIIDVYNAYNQGIDLISQFEMSSQPQMQVANTPQQQQEGLRPFHQQGQTNQSMAFPNVPPNTNFNTVGMKAPINIKKIDNQGNLVKSYENVPPGIQSLPTGPVGGTVIETPANMQSGGVRKYQAGNVMIDANGNPVSIALPSADITTNIEDNSFWGRVKRHNQLEDSGFEDFVEFLDLSGVSSWDDAYRARNSWKESGRTFPTITEVGDMLSALPAANIIKGAKFGLTTTQKLNNIYARTVKGNNYINAAEDARQELIESKSNKKYGGVRKYQSGSKLDTLYVSNPNDPRIQQYADSLSAYNIGLGAEALTRQHANNLIATNNNAFNRISNPYSLGVDNVPYDPNNQDHQVDLSTPYGLYPSRVVDIYPIGPSNFSARQKTILPMPDGSYWSNSRYELWDKPKQPVVFRPGFETLSPIGPSQITQSQPTPSLQTGYRSTPRTRPSQTVYKQDPTVSTGQYPIGEDIWNPEKRQWRRDLWDAEMQRDSRELAIPRGHKKNGGLLRSGGVRKYQSGSSPDPDLAPGITQLPVADVQTDRVPYSKISDNSRMMGVGWAKPFFETAGNNPDSKLYKIGQRILDEREQDLARAEMALEFTSVPGLMRTAERLKGKDPLRTIAKEGKLDLLSTLPLAGGMYKGLRLAEKSAGDLYDAYKLGRVARNVPEQLSGLNTNSRIIKSLASNPAIRGTTNLLQEIKGELLHGTQNRNAIARGNKKFQDWIQSPEVQAKVRQRYDDIISEKEAYLEYYNPKNRNLRVENKQSYVDSYNKLKESMTQDIARLRETKDAVLNFTPSAKEYPLKNQIKENLAQYAGSKLKSIHHGNYGVNYTHKLEPEELSLLSSGKLDEFEKSMKNRYPNMSMPPVSRFQGRTYISRAHKGKLKDQAKRESTSMHEDTHDWISRADMFETGQYNVGRNHLSQKQLENLHAYESGVELSKEEEYLAYLTDPSEQHARIMELRGHYGLKPGQQVSPEVAEKILKDIEKNATPITPDFAEVVGWNPNRLAGLFNNFWMAPAAGTVAVAAADAKPIKAINKYGGKYPSLPNKVPYYNKKSKHS